jgi:hypothetical protein
MVSGGARERRQAIGSGGWLKMSLGTMLIYELRTRAGQRVGEVGSQKYD